jgi:hypothetical protein
MENPNRFKWPVPQGVWGGAPRPPSHDLAKRGTAQWANFWLRFAALCQKLATLLCAQWIWIINQHNWLQESCQLPSLPSSGHPDSSSGNRRGEEGRSERAWWCLPGSPPEPPQEWRGGLLRLFRLEYMPNPNELQLTVIYCTDMASLLTRMEHYSGEAIRMPTQNLLRACTRGSEFGEFFFMLSLFLYQG